MERRLPLRYDRWKAPSAGWGRPQLAACAQLLTPTSAREPTPATSPPAIQSDMQNFRSHGSRRRMRTLPRARMTPIPLVARALRKAELHHHPDPGVWAKTWLIYLKPRRSCHGRAISPFAVRPRPSPTHSSTRWPGGFRPPSLQTHPAITQRLISGLVSLRTLKPQRNLTLLKNLGESPSARWSSNPPSKPDILNRLRR